MEDHVVTFDTCHYNIKENGTCILTGWMYTKGEAPSVQVRADHIPLECRLKRIPRPDVLAARPDLDFPDENAGFEIRIPNMEQIFPLAKTFRVRMICGRESIPLVQKEMEQIRQDYYADTLRLFVECVEKRRDDVYIQGCCINTAGELQMTVLDEMGREQCGIQITDIRRADLPAAFDVELSQCRGFAIRIPRSKIKGKSIHLVLSNAVTEKIETIRMGKFDRENTRLGRMMKTVNRENREKNKVMLKKMGLRGFMGYLMEETGSFSDTYSYYEKKHRAGLRELKRQSKESFPDGPKFSIVVPLYNTPQEYLKKLIDSVLSQSYQNWQLCLADGSEGKALEEFMRANYGKESRICYQYLDRNLGISGNTNEAIAMAEGDFVAFADHDDMLAPDALYHMACAVRDYPDTELIYSDEDLTDREGNGIYPHFKPDFNLDFLRCINYICHFTAVKSSLLSRVGLLRSEFDGAQDYDFILRCVEQTREIRHIPQVLYHWRSHEGSTAGNQDEKSYAVQAGKRALEAHYQRLGIDARPEFTGMFIVYRTSFQILGNPRVSILIPNKDHKKDLEKCITSIQKKSTWKNFEIVIIENNSTEPETFACYEALKRQYSNVRIVTWQGEFNYSAINNFGAAHGEGDYFLLLNNDTEVITPDWLERMLGYCQREDVAITGAKLYYPDNTVQHAGIVVGMGGFTGHILTGCSRDYSGYMGRLKAAQDMSAVTGACLMVKREVFESLGGLDESFAVALNDVDFCLRARELGKLVVFVPEAELYHYESKSRGLEETPEKKERFRGEIRRFQERHAAILKAGDPYYNPNLSLVRGDCSLRLAHETVKGNEI